MKTLSESAAASEDVKAKCIKYYEAWQNNLAEAADEELVERGSINC